MRECTAYSSRANCFLSDLAMFAGKRVLRTTLSGSLSGFAEVILLIHSLTMSQSLILSLQDFCKTPCVWVLKFNMCKLSGQTLVAEREDMRTAALSAKRSFDRFHQMTALSPKQTLGRLSFSLRTYGVISWPSGKPASGDLCHRLISRRCLRGRRSRAFPVISRVSRLAGLAEKFFQIQLLLGARITHEVSFRACDWENRS